MLTINGLSRKLAHLTTSALTLLLEAILNAWTLGVSPDRKFLPGTARVAPRNTAIMCWIQMRRDTGYSWHALTASAFGSPHGLLWLAIDIGS
jgi:hypothetical protein